MPVTDSPPIERESVSEGLLALVGERTGYPPEVLDLDLNVEADLGIDSIKRVEILGSFRKRYIPETTEAVRHAMEQVVRQKTLKTIIDEFMNLLTTHHGIGGRAPSAKDSGGQWQPDVPASGGNGATDDILVDPHISGEMPRFTMVPVPKPAAEATALAQAGSIFLITDDERGTAEHLASALRDKGARPLVLRLGLSTERIGKDRFTLDLTNLDVVRDFRTSVLTNGKSVGGIFHCLPLKPGEPTDNLSLEEWREEIRATIKSLFNLAIVFNGDLRNADSPAVVAATRLGGAFAFDQGDGTPLAVVHGGVPGLLKTLAKEWTNVHCRSVDFAADAGPEEIADHLLQEASQVDDTVEIGYCDNQRFGLQVRRAPLNMNWEDVQIHIDNSSVMLVTGGARGITAEVARRLAAAYQSTFVLCGSSALPSDETPETEGVSDPRALKMALIEQAKRLGQPVQPATVEAKYRQILKDREIRRNLAILREAGSSIEYHQVDVRDENEFGALIDRVYREHGRIDGVIHGAGIIEDKLIGDKTADSFDRVVETKTLSALTLSRKLRPDELKFLVFFTSVAGRFGNRGQSDYGAANEILAKLAVDLDRRWPGRVVAISWGPWDKAGMVSSEVKKQFEEFGIEAIDPQLGRWALDVELYFGKKTEAEVVWGNGPWAVEADEESRTLPSASASEGEATWPATIS
jgi:NAD(P)-dependent dehydrogenase (short-subunit alcohol dehydrogenase family)